jgi:hypothetical protein
MKIELKDDTDLKKLKFPHEYLLSRDLEKWHRYQSPVVNSAIALLQEVLKKINDVDRLPSTSRDYLQEKFNRIMENVQVNEEERKHNASIDRLCSWCGSYADVVIPNKVKLCSKCYKDYEKGDV